MTSICGIDEAGRGPAIGPLVICGVLADEADLPRLTAIGVKDSKLLSVTKREALFDVIKSIVKGYKIIEIGPEELDAREVSGLNLNELEAVKSAEIILALNAKKAIVDCPSVNTSAYKEYLMSHLHDRTVEIVAEHKADVKYVVVGAASILAKVTRDRRIEELKYEIGIDFGSGYPSDPKTQRFITQYHEKFPQILRHSWDTIKQAKLKAKQSSIFDFVKKSDKEDSSEPLLLTKKQLFKSAKSSLTFVDINVGNIKYFKNAGYKVANIDKPGVKEILVGDYTLTFYRTGKLLVQGTPDNIKVFLDLFVQ